MDANNDGKISEEEFINWYKQSKFFEAKKAVAEEQVEHQEKEEQEGISLEFPDGLKGRIFYIISAPIMYTLYFTVPDVRKPKWTSWCVIVFLSCFSDRAHFWEQIEIITFWVKIQWKMKLKIKFRARSGNILGTY